MGEHDDWRPPPDCSMVQDFPSFLASFDCEYEWQLVPLFMNCESKTLSRRKLQTKFSSIWSLIATTYFLIASLSLIFAVSSTISGACSYFVFDLCCFFNNLRRVQLLFLWSSLLFLPQFQALAAASSLIFAVSSTMSGRLKLLLILICAVSSTISGAWTCLLWYLVFLRQSQVLAAASCWIFVVSSTISGRLKLQISSISLLNPWLFFSLTLLDARLGQVSTALDTS